jgi:hypothetical protein
MADYDVTDIYWGGVKWPSFDIKAGLRMIL